MKIKIASVFIVLFSTSISFATTDHYNGPDKPTIPADNTEIRLTLDQCIEDMNEVMTDDANHSLAKNLCQLRKQHQAAREQALKALAALVKQFKGLTNQDHDQQLAQTIALVQNDVKNCMEALASQASCHNVTCVTDPEKQAIFCDNQASSLIKKIIAP